MPSRADDFQHLADSMRPTLPRLTLAGVAIEPQALALVPRELAWAHRTLPLQLQDRTLLCATTSAHLSGALAMLDRLGVRPFNCALADEDDIADAIVRQYGIGYLDLRYPDRWRAA